MSLSLSLYIYIYIYLHTYTHICLYMYVSIFPCRMTNKYCGDLWRRRIHAKTAQNNIKSWLAKCPDLCHINHQII